MFYAYLLRREAQLKQRYAFERYLKSGSGDAFANKRLGSLHPTFSRTNAIAPSGSPS